MVYQNIINCRYLYILAEIKQFLKFIMQKNIILMAISSWHLLCPLPQLKLHFHRNLKICLIVIKKKIQNIIPLFLIVHF